MNSSNTTMRFRGEDITISRSTDKEYLFIELCSILGWTYEGKLYIEYHEYGVSIGFEDNDVYNKVHFTKPTEHDALNYAIDSAFKEFEKRKHQIKMFNDVLKNYHRRNSWWRKFLNWKFNYV